MESGVAAQEYGCVRAYVRDSSPTPPPLGYPVTKQSPAIGEYKIELHPRGVGYFVPAPYHGLRTRSRINGHTPPYRLRYIPSIPIYPAPFVRCPS